MKKRNIKKRKTDTPSKCKVRIQALQRAIAIARYKDCEARGIEMACGGPLQADHIETRGLANTYADPDNIILLCLNHHFFWKRKNPSHWALLVEEKRGLGTMQVLRLKARSNIRTHYLKDWQEEEKKLSTLLKSLTSV